jgi:hypothetical protein
VERIKYVRITRSKTCIAFFVNLGLLLPLALLFFEAVAGIAGSGVTKCDAGFARSKFVII